MVVDRELQFVLSSVRGEVEFEEGMDVEKITRYVSFHRLWGFIYKNGRNLPDGLSRWLLREILRVEGFFSMCEEVFQMLMNVLNLRWCAVKGFVTSRLYYPVPFMRPISDLDVMVEEDGFKNSVNELKKAGFQVLRQGKFKNWAVLSHPSLPVEVDLATPSAAGFEEDFLEKFLPEGTFFLSAKGNVLVALQHMRKNLFERSVLDFADIIYIDAKKEGALESALEVAPHLRRTFQFAQSLFAHLTGSGEMPRAWWLKVTDGRVVAVRNKFLRKAISFFY